MFNFKILNSRQNKLFFKYCIIGVLSIFIELALRKFFLSFNINFFLLQFCLYQLEYFLHLYVMSNLILIYLGTIIKILLYILL